jgi:hypothetical protein
MARLMCATDVAVDSSLNWTAGANATSHDVYFGTDPDPALQGNQVGTTFDPDTLSNNTIYYWRIDEVNDQGTTAGTVWSFTTEAAAIVPEPASGPGPADGALDVGIDSDLAWTAGANATSHDVYFGTDPDPAQTSPVNQAGTSFDPGTLANATTYHWRIDEVNADGTTAGPVWSFTTEAASQSTNIHLNSLTASSIPASRNRWSASVSIKVMDGDGLPAENVLVEGVWSNGSNGGDSCTTNTSGLCPVQKSNLKSGVASVDFTVNNLSGTGFTYQQGANEVNSTITVFKDGGSANLMPDAVNDSLTTTVNTSTSGNVLTNDDQGDAPATVSSHDNTSALGVSISIGATGSFNYTPPTGVEGTDTFGYTITDDNGDSDSAMVSITIEPAVNLLPDAVNDGFTTAVDTPVSGNVMSNDNEGDAPATVSSFDAVSTAGGSVTVSPNGDFSYAPDSGYSGADSFTYTITDSNGDSDSANVSITVVGDELTLTVSSSRNKGNWYADLSWSGGSGSDFVTIRKDGGVIESSIANDGSYVDSLGKKVSGSINYEVCDSGGCASDTIQF